MKFENRQHYILIPTAPAFVPQFHPLAFVRSGYVSLNAGGAYDVGRSRYGWSRVSKSTTNAYDLYTSPTAVNPSDHSERWLAFPLRCLYLGSV